MVTCEPNTRNIYPHSTPIAPPPMMSSFSGISTAFRAAVLSHTFSPSSPGMESGTGSDPVAMITFLPEMVCFDPSAAVTSTEFRDATLPDPLTTWTLCFFIKK